MNRDVEGKRDQGEREDLERERDEFRNGVKRERKVNREKEMEKRTQEVKV